MEGKKREEREKKIREGKEERRKGKEDRRRKRIEKYPSQPKEGVRRDRHFQAACILNQFLSPLVVSSHHISKKVKHYSRGTRRRKRREEKEERNNMQVREELYE